MEVHPYLTTQGFINQLELSKDQIEKNGFLDGGVWFLDTKTIICGTFPPKTEYLNRKGYIHYSSTRNKFWKHIDAIYKKDLFLNNQDDKSRIIKSLEKIKFIKEIHIGFIDIYTQIDRIDENHARDSDLVPRETIFDTKIFTEILNSNVKQIIFVYQKSYQEFIDRLIMNREITIRKIRTKGEDHLPLEIYEIQLDGRKLHLKYTPIHGRIKDEVRRPSLKKALEDFL